MDDRLKEIALCGALLTVGPPAYVQYSLRPTRLALHPPITIPFRRSSDPCRRWNKEHLLWRRQERTRTLSMAWHLETSMLL